MKITEALLDAKRTLGTKLWVVNVTPIYEYRDHRRTENVLGYRYETVLAERKSDRGPQAPGAAAVWEGEVLPFPHHVACSRCSTMASD